MFQLPALFIRVPERHTTSIHEVERILDDKDFGEIEDIWFHYTKSGTQFAVVFFKRWFYRTEEMRDDLRRNGRIFICTRYGEWETSVYTGNERPRPRKSPSLALPESRFIPEPRPAPEPSTPTAASRPKVCPGAPMKKKPDQKKPDQKKKQQPPQFNQDIPLAPCLPEKKKRHHPPRKGKQVVVEVAPVEDPFGEEFSAEECEQYEQEMYAQAMSLYTPFYVEQILSGTLNDGANGEFKELHNYLREMFPIYLPWIVKMPEMWYFLGSPDTQEDEHNIDSFNVLEEPAQPAEMVAEEDQGMKEPVQPIEIVAEEDQDQPSNEFTPDDELYGDLL